MNRINVLDSLRGIAASLVVWFHFTTQYREEFGHAFSTIWDMPLGRYGVQLFFIVSGFVIFMTIQRCKTGFEFVSKRFVRLYPAYWACLILTFIAISNFSLSEERDTTLNEAIFNLTMLQEMFRVKAVDTVYWTLLPELMFYTFILILFKTNLLKHIKVIGIFWLLLVVIQHFTNFISYLPLPLAYFLNLKFWGFFFAGILFYKIKMENEKTVFNYALIATTFFINILIDNRILSWIALSLIYALFILFVFDKLNGLNKKIFVFVGKISYPLYLCHQTIGFIIIRQLQIKGIDNGFSIFLAILFSLIIAISVHFLIEKPLQKSGKKTFSLQFLRTGTRDI